MGEGVLEIALSVVDECRSSGDWVYFQNCHLGLDFMSKLDILLKNQELEFNPEMRIWLSCEPRDEFPIGLLHQSLKVTNEPPKGIKAGMLKTYSSVIQIDIDHFLRLILLHRPPKLGRSCTGIAEAFLLRRTNSILSNLCEQTFLIEALEFLLHNTVLTGVEGQDGGSAARV